MYTRLSPAPDADYGIFDAKAFSERTLAHLDEVALLRIDPTRIKVSEDKLTEDYFSKMDRQPRLGITSALSMIEPILQRFLSAIHDNSSRERVNVHTDFQELLKIRDRSVIEHGYLFDPRKFAEYDQASVKSRIKRFCEIICVSPLASLLTNYDMIRTNGNDVDFAISDHVLEEHYIQPDDVMTLVDDPLVYMGAVDGLHVYRCVNKHEVDVVDMINRTKLRKTYFKYRVSTTTYVSHTVSAEDFGENMSVVRWKLNGSINTRYLSEYLAAVSGAEILSVIYSHNNFSYETVYNCPMSQLMLSNEIHVGTFSAHSDIPRFVSEYVDSRFTATNQPLATDTSEYNLNFLGPIIQNSRALHEFSKCTPSAHIGALFTRHVNASLVRGQSRASEEDTHLSKVTEFKTHVNQQISKQEASAFDHQFSMMVNPE